MTSPSLTSAPSIGFVVSPNVATKLVFQQQPTNTAAGVPIATPVAVRIEDAYGNVETNDSSTHLSVAISSGPAGAVFAVGSTVTATVNAGIATFANLTLNTAGTYTLNVTDSSLALSTGASSSFVVDPNVAAKLVFAQQPVSTTAGVTIGSAITVNIKDAFDNVETGDFTSNLSLAIASGPAGATFAAGSTTSATANAGIVTFSTLIFNKAGNNYTLRRASRRRRSPVPRRTRSSSLRRRRRTSA